LCFADAFLLDKPGALEGRPSFFIEKEHVHRLPKSAQASGDHLTFLLTDLVYALNDIKYTLVASNGR
jgi:hypothetical protein